MIPQDTLKHRVLEATSRHPVPAREARRLPTPAAAALAAGAMLAVYAAMQAAGVLRAPGDVGGALRAVSSGMSLVLRLGTATPGRPASTGALVVAGTVALAIAATLLALPRRRSMLSPARGRLLAVAIGVPVLTGAWLLLWGATYADPYVRTGWRCVSLVAATAPWPFLVLRRLSRRLDPRQPHLTGAALGSAAGAWGAVMAEIWCPLADGAHVLIGHVLPLALLVGAGAAVGWRMFRLRDVA
jgi:hypothetical protein